MSEPRLKLTRLSRAGGCACKIAPDLLQQLLAKAKPGMIPPQLLAGTQSSDDAAVYLLNPQQAIVATTDFFMPIVDEPFDFGRIAATNAMSSIYAMGGTPLFALALAGMPVDTLPAEEIAKILAGGEAVCQQAGIPIAGGHTIDALEPVYGLVVIGLVNPGHLKRNSTARAGDKLILGKPLGVGAYSAALRDGVLTGSEHEALLESTTQLNTPGPVLACLDGVHALTDVGGLGLLGQVMELCRASQVCATLDFSAVPRLPKALELIEAGHVSQAVGRNLAACGTALRFAPMLPSTAHALLADPQTSGGLLVSCAPDTVTEVLSIFLQQGFGHVSVIGEINAGEAALEVI